MKIAPEQLGFDIDCVVADTMEAFIRLAREDYNIKIIPEEITDFLVEDCLDIDPQIIDDVFSRLMDDPLGAGLKPMANSIEVLEELACKAPLTFITARPEAGPISHWLKSYLSDNAYRQSRLVATGNHDDKAEHIKTLGLTPFIDDRAMTCNFLARMSTVTPIVYDQPWNLGKHSLYSVSDWLGIKRISLDN